MKKIFVISLFLICCVLRIQTNDFPVQTPYNATLQYATDSFVTTHIAPFAPTKRTFQAPKGFYEALDQMVEKSKINLDPAQSANVASLIIQEEMNTLSENPLFIDPTIIKKMEITQGGENPQKSIFFTIFNHVQTLSGKMWATQNLCTFHTNANILQKRQEKIKYLLDHQELLEQLQKQLHIIQSFENNLFTFFGDAISPDFQNMFYHKVFSKTLDKSEIAHELWRALDVWGTLPILPSYLTASLLYEGKKIKELPAAFMEIAKHNPRYSAWLIYGLLVDYLSYVGLQTKTKVKKNIQNHLMGVSQYFEAVKNISLLLDEHKDMFNQYAKNLDIKNRENISDDLKTVLELLQTDTFKGKPSAFSRDGRILKSFKIMSEISKELKPMILALGEVDTYVGLALRIKEAEKSYTNRFCFATFVDGKPYLEAKNFWNPSVLYHKDVVIPNDIIMSGDKNGLAPNIVITGPNTGGKSTILKGLFLNVLLAQTFGVAAADDFILTPFTRINCYLNITDDIAAGVSLFKAEVLRAKELIEGIKGLDHNQYSFTIMDETFSGTSPKEGEEASYSFAQKLGTFDNSMCILATHFHKLIDLEKSPEKNFKNMHVEVIRNNDDSLTFTYKIKDGPSKMNIAMDILAEQGIL